MADTSNAAVFFSYASQDVEAARRLAEALRAAGTVVWFDQDELRGGDEWDRKIRRQIRECALFVPIVSASTQARPEGYFRLEWHLAEQRSLLIAKGRPFLVPVCIDATREGEALAPDAFLAVQWTRPGSAASLALFVAQVQRLLAQPLPSSRPIGTSGPVGEQRKISASDQPVIADYELIRQIGRGSYGDVWLARGVTGIYRAIKIVWRARFTDSTPFEREFRGLKEFAAISLGESIQLALLHVGRNDAAGFFYYVMELADDVERGRTIDPATYVPLTLASLRARRGRLAVAECVAFGTELARVLAGLHRRGLVHRDIKPSNVILVDGVPKLADIGLVAPVSTASTFVGTEGYVPPEGPGSPGADVFALGKVLYEISTGLDRQEFPQLPADLNRLPDQRELLALNEVVVRACDPLPEGRYRDGAALLADLETLRAGRAVRRFATWQLAAAAAVALGLAGAGMWRWLPRRTGPAASPTPPGQVGVAAANKSIAVLPFANLSDDQENAFFADGVQEDVLTHLTSLRSLRVISSASVMPYRDTTKDLRQIGHELGVAYVLKGSVRRAGPTVRVTGRLIKAETGEQIWAKNYDGKLEDIFTLQTNVAREIAGALDAVLSPVEAAGLETHATNNLKAYECYQKARSLSLANANETDVREKIVPLLEQAVALDPGYAAAWARLAENLGQLYATGHREPQLARAKAATVHLEQLAPDSFEALMAGSNLGALTGDRKLVSERRQRIFELFPGRAEAQLVLALDASYEGRWVDALGFYRARVQLDPRNPLALGDYFNALDASRRSGDETTAVAATAAELQPDNFILRVVAASMPFRRGGTTAQLKHLLTELPPGPAGDNSRIIVRSRIAFLTGDWTGLVSLWRETGSDFRNGGFNGVSAKLQIAGAFLKLGDSASAHPLLEKTRDELQEQLKTNPNRIGTWNDLGLAFGMLGAREGARAALDRASGLVAADPRGPQFHFADRWDNTMARSYVDDKSPVIEALGRLLREPVPHPPNACARVLHVSWATIPLHGDPVFEAMLNDPRNDAPLF